MVSSGFPWFSPFFGESSHRSWGHRDHRRRFGLGTHAWGKPWLIDSTYCNLGNLVVLPCLGHVSGDEAFPSQGNIKTLSERVIELTEYRASLSEYLKAQGKTIHMFFLPFFTHYQSITNLFPLSPVHLLGYQGDFKMIHWDNGINGDLMGYFSGIDPPVKRGKLEDSRTQPRFLWKHIYTY